MGQSAAGHWSALINPFSLHISLCIYTGVFNNNNKSAGSPGCACKTPAVVLCNGHFDCAFNNVVSSDADHPHCINCRSARSAQIINFGDCAGTGPSRGAFSNLRARYSTSTCAKSQYFYFICPESLCLQKSSFFVVCCATRRGVFVRSADSLMAPIRA